MDTRVLVDCDGVLSDLVGGLCERLGGDLEPHHFTSYEFAEVMTSNELVRAWGAMSDPGFVLNLANYPDARQFLSSLQKLGTVVAVTKPFDKSPTWAYERQRWLWNRGVELMVHTSEKYMVRGDVLIEDEPHNIGSWLRANPDGRAILIDRPWNQDAFHSARAGLTYEHMQGRVKRAVSYVHALSLLEAS